jgi:hypothetical protein
VRLGERLLALFAAHVRVCPLSPGGQARVLPRAIYILPTGAGLVFGGILILMLVGSLNYQNNLGLLFTFLATAIVLVSMHHAWFNLLGLAVTARAGPPVFAGDPLPSISSSAPRPGARAGICACPPQAMWRRPPTWSRAL